MSRGLYFVLAVSAALVIQGTIAVAEENSSPVAEQQRKPMGFGEIFRTLIRNSLSPSEIEGAPASMEDHASAVLTPADLLSPEELANSRPWAPPQYSSQSGALGWNENVFQVPDKMRSRVAFWLDIYGKYTTDQGVIHDSENIDVVYMSVDFTEIMRDPKKTLAQKQVLRERFVTQKKKEIIERLKVLHGKTSSSGLIGEDLRLWRLFEAQTGKNKFIEAANMKRIRFQLGQKDRFLLGIYYSGRYLREMERIFRDNGLPIELTRLPFVESSFNIRARSRVGASGIWQIMPRTARGFLRVKSDVDERNDPLRATLASARILKQNYQMLQSWPLAITGYNHGAYGMRGITNKLGTRDISEIVSRYRSRTFGFASENFYACFLAALEVERNARKYFSEPKWGPEFDLSEIKLTRAMSYKNLLVFFNDQKPEAELANPHFTVRVRLGKTMVPAGAHIRVPSTRLKVAQDFLSGKIPQAKLMAAVQAIPMPTPKVTASTVSAAVSDNLTVQIEPEAPARALVPGQADPASGTQTSPLVE